MRLLASVMLCSTTAHAQSDPPASAEPETIDVLVKAPPSPVETAHDSTTPRYVLRADDLHSPGATLTDVIRQAPGAQVTRAGGSADLSSLSLRGSSTGQLPIYLGGVRLDDELTGSLDLSTLPVWLLHRVELHRGHSPLQADRLGMGGALLLQPRLLSRSTLRAGLGMGSFGMRSAQLSFGLGDRRAGALAAIRYRRGQGHFRFLDDRGTLFDSSDDVVRRRRNADHQQLDAWSTARIALPGGQLSLLAHSFWREAGAPGAQLNGTQQTRSEVGRFVSAASAQLSCGEAERCQLLLDTGLLASRYRLHDPLLETGIARDTVTHGRRASQRLRVRLMPRPRVTVWLGAGLTGSQLQQQIDAAPSQSASRVVLRPELALTAKPIDTLLLSAQGALGCHTTSANSGRRGCGVLAPAGRLGARWQPLPALSVFANVGRYVRVPTLGELYGVTATVRGNEELVPERGITLDGGVGVQRNGPTLGGFAQVIGFSRWADELIVYRRSSLNAVRPYNAQRARVAGIEGALGGWLSRLLLARVSLSWMDPRDTSGDALVSDVLPLRAWLLANARVTLRSPPLRSIGLAFAEAGCNYQHTSTRKADPAGLVELPAQHMLDAELALRWRRPQLALRGRVTNLIDQRAFDLLGYPLPGRAYHGSMEAQW